MTPKERVEQLERIYEEGGDEALSEFVNTNPIEFLKAIEATYIVEDDDEGLEEFQAAWSEAVRRAVDDHITRGGFVVIEKLVRIARENGMDDTADKIAAVIRQCPSGALSYSIDGVEHRDRDGDPAIMLAPNGPYVVVGGADLQVVEWGEGASRQHFTLCRCGKSQNKPFCSGAHWHHHFDEHAPAPDA